MKSVDSPFAQALRRHGFRKWYERRLLSGHAHMLLALLCVIGLMGSIEAFQHADFAGRMLDVAMVIVCAAIGLWALRRYLYLLMHAEAVANQATCGECGVYGSLEPQVEPGSQGAGESRVRCRRCGHRWTIEL
jgi:hypothetical protein